MSMVVEDKQVGSGVGQTSIRENSSYITLKNSYIYTKNNGGSSSLVLAYANYCTLDNNTIVGEGTVGNLIYLTTYNVNIPSDQLANCHNNITNNWVIGPSYKQSICYALAITGYDNLVENNTFNYVGSGLMEQWGSGTSVWEDPGVPTYYNKIINNTFNLGCGIDGQFKNVSFINNTINDNGNMKIYDNTTFQNNIVTGNLTIYTPMNITGENLHNVIFETNSTNSNLTNNNINGAINITRGTNITIADNQIDNNENYTINAKTTGNIIRNNTLIAGTLAGESTVIMTAGNILEDNKPEPAEDVILTDENYYTYFNDDSTSKSDVIGNYSKIYMSGDFYNKKFTFTNIKTNLVNNQSTLYNTTITVNDDAKININNVTIDNTKTSEPAIIINSKENIIKNMKIKQDTEDAITTIVLNGDSNTLSYNTVNITTTSTEETAAIKVSSNKNTLNNNNINIKASNDASAIIIGSEDKTADGNIILSNTINLNTTANTNTIIIGENTNKNNISRNTLNINSANATAFTVTGKSTSKNIIERNNININSTEYACAIDITTNENTVTDKITVYQNTININSEKANGIIFNDTYKNIKEANITNNMITVSANDLKVMTVTGDNVVLSGTFTPKSTEENENNVALTITDSQNISMSGVLSIELTNSDGAILNNVTNSNITGVRTSKALTIINSQNNYINKNTLNTTEDCSIRLINSSNNLIYNNTLEAEYPISGNAAVTQDENSHDNIIENNTPNRAFLTDENYNEFFDENNILIDQESDIIILASDIHDKDMIITRPITLNNMENYTMYNTTITINSTDGVRIENVNINNTDTQNPTLNLLTRATIIDSNLYQKADNINMIYTRNGAFLENDNIEFEGNNSNIVYNDMQYISVTDSNMTVRGDNTTAIKSVNSTQRSYISNNNIITYATNSNALDFYNSSSNGIQYNNITVDADNTIAMYFVINSQYIGVQNNNITSNSKTPAVLIDNANIRFNFNIVIVNNTLGDTPVIQVLTNTKGQVIYNYIEARDKAGDDAVETPGSKNLNTSTTTGYQSIVEIEAPEELSQYKTTIIPVTATDSFGEAIEGTLKVTVNGEEVIVEDNSITITPTTTDDITIVAIYQDPTGKYDTTTKTMTLPVKEATTTVVLEPVELTLGDVATITATVVDQDGEAVSVGRVAFKVNGKVLRDSNNKVIYADVDDATATISYEDTDKWDNDTTIQAIYMGSSTQPKSESEVVNPVVTIPETEEPEFAVSDATATAGEEVTITVTTKNLDAGKVVLKVNGKTVKAGDGKLYAKVEGDTTTFTYTVPKTLKAGDYIIKAVYTGGTSKLESEAKLTIE